MTDLGSDSGTGTDSDDDLRRFAARAEAEEAVRRIGQIGRASCRARV